MDNKIMATNGGTYSGRGRVHRIEISEEEYHEFRELQRKGWPLGFGLGKHHNAYDLYIRIDHLTDVLKNYSRMKKILNRLGIDKYETDI